MNELAKSTALESHQYNNYPYPRIKPKCKDKKIKIISDIKVDKPFPSMSNVKAATSTPLMQTIVINGTPAYNQKLPIANSNYTKDEIMAMPTIIVVPASGKMSFIIIYLMFNENNKFSMQYSLMHALFFYRSPTEQSSI